jgi:hypothetical protein
MHKAQKGRIRRSPGKAWGMGAGFAGALKGQRNALSQARRLCYRITACYALGVAGVRTTVQGRRTKDEGPRTNLT